MDANAFEAALKAEGFTEIETKSMDARPANASHRHPFDARALVLEGEMRVTCDGEVHTCRAGDSFTLLANREHTEQYGPDGARFIIGRRHPAK